MKDKNILEEYEVVELTHDIKENNLKVGERGVIVEIYKNGKAYEVEFIKPNGGTKALLTLTPYDIRPVASKIDFSVEYSNNLGGTITNEDSKSLEGPKVNTETKNSNGKEEFRYPFAAL